MTELIYEFLEWETLGTFSGALAAVMLLTQFTKDLKVFKKLPTQILSYIWALIILIFAEIFTNDYPSASLVILTFFNAVIVSMAANGGYSVVQRITGKNYDGELIINTSDEATDVYNLALNEAIAKLQDKNKVTLEVKLQDENSQE